MKRSEVIRLLNFKEVKEKMMIKTILFAVFLTMLFCANGLFLILLHWFSMNKKDKTTVCGFNIIKGLTVCNMIVCAGGMFVCF